MSSSGFVIAPATVARAEAAGTADRVAAGTRDHFVRGVLHTCLTGCAGFNAGVRTLGDWSGAASVTDEADPADFPAVEGGGQP